MTWLIGNMLVDFQSVIGKVKKVLISKTGQENTFEGFSKTLKFRVEIRLLPTNGSQGMFFT